MLNGILSKISRNEFDEGDAAINLFLSNAARNGLTDDEIISLSMAIAQSSQKKWSYETPPVTDIPSTGGPSSLSTLVAPLLVSICGAKILKVSATGRPAGAIDVLQILPGYRYQLSPVEIAELLQRTSYVHVLQTEDFVPADKKLIAMRRASHTMASPDLAIASLLSKKLCVSVKKCVVDVRVGSSGNVAQDLPQALDFSKRFVKVAHKLGLEVRCVLTDLRDWPQTRYLGRGESLAGLGHALERRMDTRTWQPLRVLAIEALNLLNPIIDASEADHTLGKALSESPIQHVAKLLEQHGVSGGAFEARLQEVEAFAEFPIKARSNRWVCHIDLGKLKDVVTTLYSYLPPAAEGVPPWEVGVRWTLNQKQTTQGQDICSVRVRKVFAHLIQPKISYIQDQILASIVTLDRLPDDNPDLSGVVLAVVDEHGNQRSPLGLNPDQQSRAWTD